MNKELKNRIEGEDFRRQLFSIQEELIKGIRESFYTQLHDKHKSILEKHPFNDNK